MNAEIISVGAEVISGDVNNTDASYLSRRLNALGISVTRHTAVDDRPENITEALATAVARSPIIIFTGGLGPTADDMTKEVVCEAVGLELTEHAESLSRLEAFFAARQIEMPQINRKQALFPENAIVFPNPMGTADGCAIESGNQCIIMLPGPPKELESMFETSVEEYLMGKTDQTVVCHTVKVFGMGESKIAEVLGDILIGENPQVATYVENGDIRIKIISRGSDWVDCEERCRSCREEVVSLLGNKVYAEENITLQQRVVSLLQNRNKKLATAESCTAGMLSEMLTDVAGASEVFELGVSAYANRVKKEILDVPESLLKKHGAVSSQVAQAMAAGALKKGKANFGIGITGIAGPGGGTSEKPVGLVYVSLYDGERYFTRKLTCNPESSREKIRTTAAMNALDMMRLYLTDDEEFLALPVSQKNKKKKKWWHTIIPVKGDKPANVVRKMIMLLCLLVFIGSGAYVLDYVGQSVVTGYKQNQVRDIFHSEATINEKFAKLQEINPDTIGWITVPGTQCDNPVVKNPDDKNLDEDKYLNTTFEGEKSKYGTIYAEYTCKIEKPENGEVDPSTAMSDNIILHGHHMRDGKMFGELKQYRKLKFYQENPTIQFTTLYDKDIVEWKVIAAFIVNSTKYDSKDRVFNYRVTDFENERAFMVYMNELQQRTIINTGVDVQYGDKFVTLSTCTYEFDDARFVVVARRVREGESATVDVSKATVNKDVVYPKAYYKGSSSGRTDVTSLPAESIPNTSNPNGSDSSSNPVISQPESNVDEPSSVPDTNTNVDGGSQEDNTDQNGDGNNDVDNDVNNGNEGDGGDGEGNSTVSPSDIGVTG